MAHRSGLSRLSFIKVMPMNIYGDQKLDFRADYKVGMDAGNGLPAAPSGGLVCGLVLSAAGDAQTGLQRVSFAGQPLPSDATVAAACLLQPEPGDWVLLCRTPSPGAGAESERWWVLSVLQRGQPAAQATLAVLGADAVVLKAPKLSLAAQNSLHVAAGDIAVQAHKTSVNSATVEVVMATGRVVARQLTRMATVFHSLADTVTEHCRTRVVVVDEVNSTQAGIELVESQDAMLLKGGQVMVDAKKTVRVDGKHILMG
jgi:hypothetical protein